jgi:hypothetical protein
VVGARDARDLARVDVLSGRVDAPNAPIPHWREYHTNSRRTSLIIDPPRERDPSTSTIQSYMGRRVAIGTSLNERYV